MAALPQPGATCSGIYCRIRGSPGRAGLAGSTGPVQLCIPRVACQPEQILVGAGLQTLLMILLPLLPVTEKKVGLEAPGFPQAEQIFRLMGWETRQYDPADPNGDWPGLLMISPANPYKGRALTEKERNNLIVATQLERVYLLEDDYNGEFRYLHRPTPALHSFGNRERIIYLGSFSRTMLPSLRISYMVLPVSLLPAYQKLPPATTRLLPPWSR